MSERSKPVDALIIILVLTTLVMAFLVLNKYGFLEWTKTRRIEGTDIKVKCTCEVEK